MAHDRESSPIFRGSGDLLRKCVARGWHRVDRDACIELPRGCRFDGAGFVVARAYRGKAQGGRGILCLPNMQESITIHGSGPTRNRSW